jgi:CRISPR-associated protein Csx10
LGALVAHASRHVGTSDFRRVFRDGEILFPSLYPAEHPHRGSLIYATIPCPLDMAECSRVPGLVEAHAEWINGSTSWATREGEPEACPRCAQEGMPEVKVERRGAYVAHYGLLHEVVPALREELHIRMDPETGRVKSGDLYGYTAIDAGQFFVGELVCVDEAAYRRLLHVTGLPDDRVFSLRLGRASRRGYGRVTARLVRRDRDAEQDPPVSIGRDLAERLGSGALTDPITLTFLTDTILVDAWGRFVQRLGDPAGSPPETARVLCNVLLPEPLGLSLTMVNWYTAACRVDGFNRHVSLPRWRDVALKGGSCAGFTLTGALDRPGLLGDLIARWRELERDGVGLRRHEGFGRIAFNHPVQCARHEIKSDPIRLGPLAIGLAQGDGAGMVSRRQDRIREWERDIERSISGNEFSDQQWSAVARHIHRQSSATPPTGSSPQSLVDACLTVLDTWGKPSRFGAHFYRDKPGFLSGRGRAGAKSLGDFLRRLGKGETDPIVCVAALARLAGRLTECSRSETGDQP